MEHYYDARIGIEHIKYELNKELLSTYYEIETVKHRERLRTWLLIANRLGIYKDIRHLIWGYIDKYRPVENKVDKCKSTVYVFNRVDEDNEN